MGGSHGPLSPANHKNKAHDKDIARAHDLIALHKTVKMRFSEGRDPDLNQARSAVTEIMMKLGQKGRV